MLSSTATHTLLWPFFPQGDLCSVEPSHVPPFLSLPGASSLCYCSSVLPFSSVSSPRKMVGLTAMSEGDLGLLGPSGEPGMEDPSLSSSRVAMESLHEHTVVMLIASIAFVYLLSAVLTGLVGLLPKFRPPITIVLFLAGKSGGRRGGRDWRAAVHTLHSLFLWPSTFSSLSLPFVFLRLPVFASSLSFSLSHSLLLLSVVACFPYQPSL